MADIKIEKYFVGEVGTNCYFVINQDTKEMLIVDPGGSAEKLAGMIKKEHYQPIAILLTHGHFDHAMDANRLSEEYHIKIYAHEDERQTLEQPQLNLTGMIGQQKQYHADVFVKDGEILHLAEMDIKVLHTPGHTVGGCCFYLEEEKVLLSGDTLFSQSVGRTDFPKGSHATLIRSIKDKLMVLPDDTMVYPGHEDSTSIGRERKYNPFIV
ncbi:MBL fold metallo-hydrolase [Lachnospiraceae bacterium ZAX-1]